MSKEKIAILGSGVGAITSAYYLTSTQELRDKYDVTIYQQGWRWGGKGASGRNKNDHERIEEHGLHVWMGFYENAFYAMRDCYGELDRREGPIQDWQDAFKPHDFIVLMDHIQDKDWQPWKLHFPRTPGLPGSGTEPGSLQEVLKNLFNQLLDHGSDELEELFKSKKSFEKAHSPDNKFLEAVEHLGHRVEDLFLPSGKGWIELLKKLLTPLLKVERILEKELESIVHIADVFLKWLWKEIKDDIEDNVRLRQLWFFFDFSLAFVKGILAEHVLTRGLSTLDKYDFKEFLAKYGASDFTVNAPPIRGFYDLAFAFESGDIEKPNMAAGVALRAALRMALTYQGAIFWKMQAGMGDIVFAPYYEVLKKRGVNMKFFHQVQNITSDGQKINSIVMQEQIKLRKDLKEYSPLVDVKGVPSWPSQPHYDQIDPKQAKKLQKDNINLESFYSTWKGGVNKTLEVGKDFDHVVLGISVAGFPYIAKDLIKQDDKFSQMVETQNTTQTQAMQLWLKPDLQELGWEDSSPILDAYVEPMNTWADMTQVLPRETWDNDPKGPKNIAYFCGPLKGPDSPPPPKEKNFPEEMLGDVKEVCVDLLQKHMEPLWPKAVDAKGAFKWNLLVGQGKGEQLLDQQYLRANVDPSERYVLSTKNSVQFRLSSKETKFANLYLAGDWTKNGLNAGCVEAATISGMMASQALCGIPEKIFGDYDLD